MCRQKTRLFCVLPLENCHEIALYRSASQFIFPERCLKGRTSLLSSAMANWFIGDWFIEVPLELYLTAYTVELLIKDTIVFTSFRGHCLWSQILAFVTSKKWTTSLKRTKTWSQVVLYLEVVPLVTVYRYNTM